MLTFLGIIVLVIFIHELGHYVAARAMGVAVDSFSIGFGKVLLKKKLWGTEWRLSLLPLGGYIKPRGEQDYYNVENDPESFWSVSPWRRAFIAVMGPVFNLLLPWPLYFMLLVGQPYPDVVVPEGAQAHRIGVVEAAGYAHKVSLKMYSSIWEAVVQPRKEPMSIKEVGGPVAVYEFTEQARKRSVDTGDWGFLIDWIAFFSINLGVINLLPIPVLDGGHISISVVEGIRRKKLAVKTRNVLNIIGAVLVLGIFVLAITSDVLRLTGI
jgi:membrane-associated protease RseP (regulator of RpoE activity)